jgi:biopolymer transport protein ExbD
MAKRSAPEVNAGSMADIAFLLLIFFLVTTTMEKDSGISRKLPPMEESEEDVVIKQKNIFTVLLNKHDQLLVEDELMELKDLRKAAVEFLDNGGSTDNDGNPCDYCQGKKDPSSSDHPDKAIISLKNERETSYAMYISVQNELVGAYNELRNRRALQIGPQRGFQDMNFQEMQKNAKDVNWPGNKEKLKEVIDQIKVEYPQKLSEVQQ